MMNALSALIANMMNAVWVLVALAFALVEASTVNMVSIWFALGAVGGLIASIAGFSFQVQLAAFVLLSALALAATRPLVRKYTSGTTPRTNADRVLGMVGRVTETVDSESGAVYVDGKTWSARTSADAVIPVGEQVQVERLEGVKLYVSPFQPVKPKV